MIVWQDIAILLICVAVTLYVGKKVVVAMSALVGGIKDKWSKRPTES